VKPADNYKQETIIYYYNRELPEGFKISQVTSGGYVAQKLLTNTARDDLPTELIIKNVGDFNGDRISDYIISTVLAHGNAGQIDLMFGRAYNTFILNPLPVNDIDKGIVLTGQAGEMLGFATSAVYDFNQDGLADLIVSSPGIDNKSGKISVYFGNHFGLIDSNPFGFSVYGAVIASLFGYSVAELSNKFYSTQFKGILIGAPGDCGGNVGALYIIYKSDNLPSTFYANDIVSSGYGEKICGTNIGDFLGTSVSAGDFNGDGQVDVIVGAPGYNNAGACYLFLGKNGNFGITNLSNLHPSQGIVFRGTNHGDLTGFSVVNLGDINGDGIDDAAIGSPGYNGNIGKISVILGSTNISGSDLNALPNSKGFTIYGVDLSGGLGSSVQHIGDVNNDGYNDIFISADRSGNGWYIYGNHTLSDIHLDRLLVTQGKALSNTYNGIDLDFQVALLGLAVEL